MNVNQVIEIFCKYSPQEQTDFLLRFAHAVTILARDTYEVGEKGLTNPSRLRLINEVQHRILSFLLALRKNDEKRYPEDVLLKIILEHPEDPELQRQLQETFDHLMGEMISTT
jgi:hypothetical protein